MAKATALETFIGVTITVIFVSILVISASTWICVAFTRAGKNNVGEYFCHNHGGLVSINETNYREFTCEDGSSWIVNAANTRPKYQVSH